MDCSDLLTCGECHLVFCLSDIVSFIRHKQTTCPGGGGGGLQEPDHSDDDVEDDDDDDDDDAADRTCANGTESAEQTLYHTAVVCGIDEDDETDLCANGAEETSAELHQDKHPSHLGSTLLYIS